LIKVEELEGEPSGVLPALFLQIANARRIEADRGKAWRSRVTQFSIFLPNKVGALLHVVKLLNEHHVHVLAVNVQDSADTADRAHRGQRSGERADSFSRERRGLLGV
jgi:hypothetical protein